jgi:hypothetical protein
MRGFYFAGGDMTSNYGSAMDGGLLTEDELNDLINLPVEGRMRFRALLHLVAKGARERGVLHDVACSEPIPSPQDRPSEEIRHPDVPLV